MVFSSKKGFSFLVLGTAFLSSSLFSLSDRDKLSLFGKDPRLPIVDQTQAIEKTLSVLSKVKKDGEGLFEDSDPSKNASLQEKKANLIVALEKGFHQQVRGLNKGINDAVLFGFVGKDMYKVLQGFDTEKPTDALKIAFAVKGAEAAGTAFLEGAGKRLSSLFEYGLDKITDSLFGVQQFVYKKATGRVGEAFSADDIKVSQKTMNETLKLLSETARKANSMSSRDNRLRLDDEEQENVDPSWLPLRTLIELKLRNQIALLDRGLSYYKNDGTSRIVLYARQIRDGIAVLVEHVLLKTKSYQDLGSGVNLNALQSIQRSIDSDFDSLLSNLVKVRDMRNASDLGGKRSGDRRDRDDLAGLS